MTWRSTFLAITVATALAAAVVHADDRGRQRSSRSRARADAQSSREAPPGPDARTFTVGRGSALDVSNISGHVRITARAGNLIDVRAVRRSGRDGAQEPRIEMVQIGNRVEVRIRHAQSRGSSRAVDLTVVVPPDATVNARSVSGDVALAGVTGETRLETVSGNVEAVDAGNLAQAKTVSGAVSVRGAGSAATLTLRSISGAVVATSLTARAVDASSVSGRIELTGVDAPRVFAKSLSGGVEFSGALAGDGRYDLTSHSGSVRLRLPAGAAFDLSAETFSGRLTSDFPITLRSTAGGRSRTLRGVAGNGGAQLVVRSFSGSVTIGRQ